MYKQVELKNFMKYVVDLAKLFNKFKDVWHTQVYKAFECIIKIFVFMNLHICILTRYVKIKTKVKLTILCTIEE